MTDHWKEVDLTSQPGHLARRVQQIAVALFAQEVGDLGLTPVQYSALQTICTHPGIDQKRLAATIDYDTSTIAGVIDRLEARGLVVRNVAPHDRRARLVTPTPQGIETLAQVVPLMLRVQERLLGPFSPAQREDFMRLLTILVDAHAPPDRPPAKG